MVVAVPAGNEAQDAKDAEADAFDEEQESEGEGVGVGGHGADDGVREEAGFRQRPEDGAENANQQAETDENLPEQAGLADAVLQVFRARHAAEWDGGRYEGFGADCHAPRLLIRTHSVLAQPSKPRPTCVRQMERVSLVLGGSILAPPDLDPAFLGELADRLATWSKGRQLFVVVGGGNPARNYIQAARASGVAEDLLDRIGIQATRLNAQTLACILRRKGVNVNLEIPHSVAQALRMGTQHDLVVMGGTVPGHSTDYVAVELAVDGKCVRFVNATNVDGVYTRDPNKHKDAQRKPRLNFEDLLAIIEEREWTAAGAPGVIDGPSTVLLATKGITTCVADGRNLDNLGKAIAGQEFHGSLIQGKPVKLPGVR